MLFISSKSDACTSLIYTNSRSLEYYNYSEYIIIYLTRYTSCMKIKKSEFFNQMHDFEVEFPRQLITSITFRYMYVSGVIYWNFGFTLLEKNCRMERPQIRLFHQTDFVFWKYQCYNIYSRKIIYLFVALWEILVTSYLHEHLRNEKYFIGQKRTKILDLISIIS